MLGIGVFYFMSITVTYYAMYMAKNFKSKPRIHWFLIGAWGRLSYILLNVIHLVLLFFKHVLQ